MINQNEMYEIFDRILEEVKEDAPKGWAKEDVFEEVANRAEIMFGRVYAEDIKWFDEWLEETEPYIYL